MCRLILILSHADSELSSANPVNVMAWFRNLKLLDEVRYLLNCKDWAILTDVFITYVATSTFSHATFHLALQCSDNLTVLKAQLLKHLKGEPYHDGRATNNRHGILRRRFEFP